MKPTQFNGKSSRRRSVPECKVTEPRPGQEKEPRKESTLSLPLSTGTQKEEKDYGDTNVRGKDKLKGASKKGTFLRKMDGNVAGK